MISQLESISNTINHREISLTWAVTVILRKQSGKGTELVFMTLRWRFSISVRAFTSLPLRSWQCILIRAIFLDSLASISGRMPSDSRPSLSAAIDSLDFLTVAVDSNVSLADAASSSRAFTFCSICFMYSIASVRIDALSLCANGIMKYTGQSTERYNNVITGC